MQRGPEGAGRRSLTEVSAPQSRRDPRAESTPPPPIDPVERARLAPTPRYGIDRHGIDRQAVDRQAVERQAVERQAVERAADRQAIERSRTPAPSGASPRAPSDPARTAEASEPGRREMLAMARLGWALSRTVRMLRHAHGEMGRPQAELAAIESALEGARLPGEFVEIAKRIAQLPSNSTLPARPRGTLALASFRRGLAAVAHGVMAENVASELDALADRYDVQGDDDPQPILDAMERLTETVARGRESIDTHHDALAGVQVGIKKIVEEEQATRERLRACRAQVLAARDLEGLEAVRRALAAETERLEGLLEGRKNTLDGLHRQSRSARRRAVRLTAALADATSAASTDLLTGLGNRRALDRTVEALEGGTGQVAVLMIDLDHFKRINDTHGHGVGDRVLTHVAETLQHELRGDDHGFRIGGEEFVVLLANCDLPGAARTAERLRQRIERSPAPLAEGELWVTASIGASGWSPGQPFDHALQRADVALYQAKSGGRNRCETVP